MFKQIIKNLKTDATWKIVQMISLTIRSQENDIFLATKAIIETHVAAKHYYNYSKGII